MKVKSSMIETLSYSKGTQELTVVFHSNSSKYIYRGVQPDVFKALKGADSIGQFFCETIKGSYDYDKV